MTRKRKHLLLTGCLVLTVLLLTACGSRKGTATTVTTTPSITTTVATPTPAVSTVPTTLPTTAPTIVPMATASPTLLPVVTTIPTNAPTVVTTPTPTPVAVTTPTPTPVPATPTPTPRLPVITKSPTDETVDEGGSCWFVAKYENAEIAVWHFISPDGQTDLTYEAAQKYFPTMEILNGMYSSMQLKNIPYAANGWRVYCRYSNPNGYVDTGSALITVRPGAQAAAADSYSVSGNTSGSVIVVNQGFEGRWADEIAGRATMTVSWLGDSRYRVEVNWGSSAFETSCWTMTLTETGYGTGTYDNGEYYVQTFRDDGSYSISDQHWDGTGSVTISSDGKLHWFDSYNGYDVVMIRA